MSEPKKPKIIAPPEKDFVVWHFNNFAEMISVAGKRLNGAVVDEVLICIPNFQTGGTRMYGSKRLMRWWMFYAERKTWCALVVPANIKGVDYD